MTGIVAHNQLEVWLTLTGQVAQFIPEYSIVMIFRKFNISHGTPANQFSFSWADIIKL